MFVCTCVRSMSFAWFFFGYVCAVRHVTREIVDESKNDVTGHVVVQQMLIRNERSGGYLVGGRKGDKSCDLDNSANNWYVNQCPYVAGDDGFVWIQMDDGKLQNKKTGRWLYAEKKNDHEWKDNSEIVDWANNAGKDCLLDQNTGLNKCYDWVFETDGKIKNVASQFYLCADSWGENPRDSSLRVLDDDYAPNVKDYDPLTGYLWAVEPAPCTPPSLPGTDFMIKNLRSGNFLVGGRKGDKSCDLDNSQNDWYVNQCPFVAGDDGFVWSHTNDGKLQNKKTGRWFYAEKKNDHEWKDNSENVDWASNAGKDCVQNKCYDWVFESDGRIKNVASQFYLCADSWGENPRDSSLRVLDYDYAPNVKDYDPTTGYLWEPVCTR